MKDYVCLNPYFNGFTILTLKLIRTATGYIMSLNPYFNGFTILTLMIILSSKVKDLVSILILMDSLFLLSQDMYKALKEDLSQSLF